MSIVHTEMYLKNLLMNIFDLLRIILNNITSLPSSIKLGP